MSSAVKLEVREAPRHDVLADVVRVHHSHRTFAKPGDVILIKIGNKKAYANVRPNDEKDTVCFDRAMREKLNVELGGEIEFLFEKAGFWGGFRWAWNTTDAMPRIAARLGLTSVGLGLLGFSLGIIAICL